MLCRGQVTFLFTDIEDSTRPWESTPADMAAAVQAHDVIVRSAIERHGGHVFATGGDGFSAAFSSAVDAVTAAVKSQRELGGDEAIPFGTRMALHTGEAVAARPQLLPRPATLEGRVHHSDLQAAQNFGLP